MSELYEKDTYINKNIPYVFNTEIMEYDMKSAAYSIIQEYKLLDKKKIDKLSSLEKQKRNTLIGIYQRDDEEFKENLKLGFIDARKRFFEANELIENDILSIKKDAIFTSKYCKHRDFGHLSFRPKNTYTSYVYLKTERRSLELYYRNGVLDVKGISDTKLKEHSDYMCKFLLSYFKKMESDTPENVLPWLRHFITKYKFKELEVGYYRSFDDRSIIQLDGIDNSMGFYYIDEVTDDVDIRYNYFNVLMKLLKISI